MGTKKKAEEKTSESNTDTSGSSSGSGSGNENSNEDDETVSSDGRTIVSKEKVYDCDGSGNGYYIITYEDGTVEYEDFYN